MHRGCSCSRLIDGLNLWGSSETINIELNYAILN